MLNSGVVFVSRTTHFFLPLFVRHWAKKWGDDGISGSVSVGGVGIEVGEGEKVFKDSKTKSIETTTASPRELTPYIAQIFAERDRLYAELQAMWEGAGPTPGWAHDADHIPLPESWRFDHKHAFRYAFSARDHSRSTAPNSSAGSAARVPGRTSTWQPSSSLSGRGPSSCQDTFSRSRSPSTA